MRCGNCNNEIDVESSQCSYCNEKIVRVLTTEERNEYDGITIDSSGKEDSFKEDSFKDTKTETGYDKVYVRTINTNNSFLTKVVFIILGLIISGFLFFVALPITLIVISIAVFIWILLGYMRK